MEGRMEGRREVGEGKVVIRYREACSGKIKESN